jgi:hypothetical protein
MQSDFSSFFHFHCIMLTNHFFKKSGKKYPQKNENGHFKNVQNENFQNTFSNNFLYPLPLSPPLINLPN